MHIDDKDTTRDISMNDSAFNSIIKSSTYYINTTACNNVILDSILEMQRNSQNEKFPGLLTRME